MSVLVNFRSVVTFGSDRLDYNKDYPCNIVDRIDFTVAALTTNQQQAIAFTKALLQVSFLVADGAITLKTNSTGSPADTIVFAAGVPMEWVVNSNITDPWTADVTTTYWTTGAGSTVHVYGYIGRN